MEIIDQTQLKELTKEEILNLQYSIGYLFIEYPIEELKNIMWELYSGWIYESADAVTPDEIRNMLMFYKAWELFINDLYEYTQHLERNVLNRRELSSNDMIPSN